MSSPDPTRRSQRARSAILDAALAIAVERGYARLTIEAIAERAGVGKQTIYRWWPSKGAVLLDAINEAAGESTDFPDTGDVIADLRTQIESVAAQLTSAELAPYARGVLPATQDDPELAAAVLEKIIQPRIRDCIERLAKAQAAGQLRSDIDLEDAVEVLYAPLYYRILLHTRPLRPADVPGLLDLLFTGLAPPAPDH